MKTMPWLAPIRFFQRSFYRKILVSFFFIIILTISVVVANFYTQTARDLKRQSVDSMERLNQQVSATLNSYIGNIRGYAWDLFGDPNFQAFVGNMGSDADATSYYRNKFNQFINGNRLLSSITVSQLDGFSTQAGVISTDISDPGRRRAIESAIEQNGYGVWVTFQSRDWRSGKSVNTLTFVQAVRRISPYSPGPIIGVMMYDLSSEALQEWLGEVEGDGTNRYYIVEARNGAVVFSLDQDAGKPPPLNEAQLQHIRTQPQNGHFYTDGHDDSSLVVYRQLAGTEWMLVSKYPAQDLLKPVADLTKRTLVIGVISLFLSMLLASLLASRTIASLKVLSKGMKAIETGNYEISLPVRSIDEIGYISSSFNRMAKEINRLIMKVYEAEIVKKNAEIKSLQSQINPHFLYNTLGVIDSLSLMDGDGRVSLISRSLAKMFRYNISGNDISTLEAEIQQIRLYLSIQQIRFDSRLEYSIYLEPGLEVVPIPKLLFQPLVENSILHGISRGREGGTVRVEAIKSEEGFVQISVWNNGPSIEEERQAWLDRLLNREIQIGWMKEEHSSIGLSNVQSRIKLFYGNDCGITFYSSAELGTAFIIRIRQTLS